MNNNYILLSLALIAGNIFAQDHTPAEVPGNAPHRNSYEHKQLLKTFINKEHASLTEDKALLNSYFAYNQKLASNLKKVCVATFPISFMGFYLYFATREKVSSTEPVPDERMAAILNGLLNAVCATGVTGVAGLAIVRIISHDNLRKIDQLQTKITTTEDMLKALQKDVLQGTLHKSEKAA